MPFTFGTITIAVKMAGENADATITADTTTLNAWSEMSEGYIEVKTGKTYLDDYSSLPAGVQEALETASNAFVALLIIANNTSGYLSREADTLMNLNTYLLEGALADLKDYSKIKLKSPI